MKKLLTLALALMLMLSLAACGGTKDPTPSGSGTTDPGTSQQEPSSMPDDTDPPNESNDRYTEFGLSFDEVQPEGSTSFEVTDDSESTYYVEFAMPETVIQEVGFAYYKKIYDLTAAISEGGTNYKQSGGTAISPEVSPMGTWEDENSASEYNMNVWFYKYDGKLLQVSIIAGIDSDKSILVMISDYT